MTDAPLLNPKPIVLTSRKGEPITYILSDIPFMQCREIVTQYIATGLPKLGDYKSNEAQMEKLFAYVGIEKSNGDGQKFVMRLSSPTLINNAIPDLETGMRLEWAMLNHNSDFLQHVRDLISSKTTNPKVVSLLTKMRTLWSRLSAPQGSPPFTN